MKEKKSRYGQGYLYQQKGTTRWTLQFMVGGKRIREATGTSNRNQAVKLLNARLAAVNAGAPIVTAKITLADLARMVAADYEANQKKSGRRMVQAFAHVIAFFGERTLARTISADRVTEYIAARQAEKHRQGDGASNATINRELAALKRGLSLAVRAGKLAYRPAISLLSEKNNVRQGFVEEADLANLLEELPVYLRGFAEAAYRTGWRAQELLTREWRHVDFEAGWLVLEPGETKNGRARTVPLTLPRLRAILEEQRESARVIGGVVPWVFHRPDGKRIKDYARAWSAACERAGLEGKLVHDMRRSAIRNWERAGVSRSAGMAMSGHETSKVYERYSIADAAALLEAAEKEALDAIVDAVLAYKPRPKSAPAKRRKRQRARLDKQRRLNV
jgi:integrase